MIIYENDNTSSFSVNKNYIEAIERELKKFNSNCSGYCNGNGYSVEAEVVKNQLCYSLRFQKNHDGISSGTGNFDVSNTTVSVSGLNSNLSIVMGKSKLKRLFASKNCRDLIPSPYYLSCSPQPSESFLRLIARKIVDRELSAFTLEKGILQCTIHAASSNPMEHIGFVELLIQNME